jgi:DNA-binding transcriptional MerR regulator
MTRSEKAPNALRTIGEAADLLGVEPHVLRFWEEKFHVIAPAKHNGRRYYRPSDLEILRFIRELLHNRGFTIRGAQLFLEQNGVNSKIDEEKIRTLFQEISSVERRSSHAMNRSSSSEKEVRKNQKLLLDQSIVALKQISACVRKLSA